jgi:metal-responsive CopG/Arc/MetJ family transcriptional regulator
MKTAISIDTPLLEETDRVARKMGLNRSRLVALALTDFLRERRNREMLEQLNAVYGEEPSAAEQPTGPQRKATLRSVIQDRW